MNSDQPKKPASAFWVFDTDEDGFIFVTVRVTCDEEFSYGSIRLRNGKPWPMQLKELADELAEAINCYVVLLAREPELILH